MRYAHMLSIYMGCAPLASCSASVKRGWFSFAEQPAPAPHAARQVASLHQVTGPLLVFMLQARNLLLREGAQLRGGKRGATLNPLGALCSDIAFVELHAWRLRGYYRGTSLMRNNPLLGP